jgi:hypothetical protein
VAYPRSDMNIWLLSLGLVGIVAAGFWYVNLLGHWAPGLRVAFLSKGEMPTQSMYLWLLTVLVSESFVVNAFPGNRGGFSIVGGVAVAFVLSELGRWWHNRTVPAASPEPPPEWFPGGDAPDDSTAS